MESILGRYIDYCVYGFSQLFPIIEIHSNCEKIYWLNHWSNHSDTEIVYLHLNAQVAHVLQRVIHSHF